jgi:hypothetical protein
VSHGRHTLYLGAVDGKAKDARSDVRETDRAEVIDPSAWSGG